MVVNILNNPNYPDDGNHLICELDGLPFDIRKGEDRYYWTAEDGTECAYDGDRWIVWLTDGASESLTQLFEVKIDTELSSIIHYCVNIYVESLHMEIERTKNKFSNYIGD